MSSRYPKFGRYRSFNQSLLDEPRFRRLSSNARLAYFVLKTSLGPSHIAVVPALEHVLAERTGLDLSQIAEAVGELCKAEMVQREGPMVWIVEGLNEEPAFTATNSRHRTAIQKHLASLPRVPMVERFRARYSEYLKLDDKTSRTGNRLSHSPSDSLSQQEKRSGETSKERKETETNARPAPPRTRDVVVAVPDSAVEFFRAFYAASTPDRQRDIAGQLRSLLSVGVMHMGETVRAVDEEHLQRCCAEVISRPPRDPNAAIAWLLEHLRGHYINGSAPPEVRAVAAALNARPPA